jgi:hypothetical protein
MIQRNLFIKISLLVARFAEQALYWEVIEIIYPKQSQVNLFYRRINALNLTKLVQNIQKHPLTTLSETKNPLP